MKQIAVIAGVVGLVALLAALIVPMWWLTADIGLSATAYGAIILMVIFCFLVGGGLMFLIFYSARKGYDDAHHEAAKMRGPDLD
jgi:hypothetical protein